MPSLMQVMKALLATFQDKILTTFRSKYSQYLIFYACHFQTQYSREFLQSLILIVISSEYSDGIRHAAGKQRAWRMMRQRITGGRKRGRGG